MGRLSKDAKMGIKKSIIEGIDIKDNFTKNLKSLMQKTSVIDAGPLKNFYNIDIEDIKNLFCKFVVSAKENKIYMYNNSNENVTDSLKIKLSDHNSIEFIELITGMMFYVTYDEEVYKFVVYSDDNYITLEYLSSFLPDKIKRFLINREIIKDDTKEKKKKVV